MKLVLPGILFLILMFSCNAPSGESTEIKTIITGQVSGYAEVSDHDMVKLLLADPVSGNREIITSLDSLGRFRFEPEVEYPREFVLNYSGHLHYFVYPGDSLYFEIDGKCWSKLSQPYGRVLHPEYTNS